MIKDSDIESEALKRFKETEEIYREYIHKPTYTGNGILDLIKLAEHITLMEEPLKISKIIEMLNSIKNEHGDIKVGTWADGILKFIRSVKFIEAKDYTGNIVDNCAALQWWDEDE